MSSLNCGFSGFITNFINNFALNDKYILSNLRLVDSQTGNGHVTDGFIYIGNILIQFSATTNPSTDISVGTEVIIRFPVDYTSTRNYSCIAVPYKSSNNNNPNINLVENVIGDRTSSSCRIRINDNGGNFYWIAIGLAQLPPSSTPASNASGTVFCNLSNDLYSNSFNQIGNLLSQYTSVTSVNTGHSIDAYCYIGNLLIQFSASSGLLGKSYNNDPQTITFPVAYQTKPYLVLATGLYNNSQVNLSLVSNFATATTFNVAMVTGNSNNSNLRWIAIGPAN